MAQRLGLKIVVLIAVLALVVSALAPLAYYFAPQAGGTPHAAESSSPSDL